MVVGGRYRCCCSLGTRGGSSLRAAVRGLPADAVAVAHLLCVFLESEEVDCGRLKIGEKIVSKRAVPHFF